METEYCLVCKRELDFKTEYILSLKGFGDDDFIMKFHINCMRKVIEEADKSVKQALN